MTISATVPGCGPLEISGGPVCCVMLHGSLASPHYFEETAEYIAGRGFSLAAPLLAGHGTSWRDLRDTTWSDLMESARAGVDSSARMGCESFFLLGHSLGGALALALAAERPPGLLGVITISAPVSYPEWITVPFGAFASLVPVLPRVLRDTMEKDRELFKMYDKTPLVFFRRILEALPGNRELLPRVAAPLLVMHGKNDLNVPAVNARRVYRETGSAEKELWLIDGEGHGPLWFGKREKVMERIAGFMLRISGGVDEA